MGIIKFFFLGVIPSIGISVFLSLRLGNKLPIACRETGRQFGMFYNYFKLIIFHLKPKERESNEVVQMLRNINQQSHAFTRELQSNILSTRKDLQELIPGMKINPFENVGLKNEPPLEMKKKNNGANIIEHSIFERRRIVTKKKISYEKDDAFYH